MYERERKIERERGRKGERERGEGGREREGGGGEKVWLCRFVSELLVAV